MTIFVDYVDVSQYHGADTKQWVGSIQLKGTGKGRARLALVDPGFAERSAVTEFLGVDEKTHAVYIMSAARDSEVVECSTGVQLEGSYASSLQIKSHAGWVRVRGNPSRFNRRDNLFGYSLDECMAIVNAQLSKLGLPPFTVGEPIDSMERQQAAEIDALRSWQGRLDGEGDGEGVPVKYTGAAFARIDVTRNYSAGSELAARLAIRSYQSRAKAWAKKNTYGEETCMWHTSHYSVKAYRKGPDMLVHCPESAFAGWANTTGIVRHEVAFKSRYLSRSGLRYWGNLNMGTLHRLFEAKTEILRRPDASLDPLAIDAVPRQSRVAYALWLRGEDCRSLLSRSALYRHRKVLMETASVDIAEQRAMGSATAIVRVIDLVPAQMPAGYELWAA